MELTSPLPFKTSDPINGLAGMELGGDFFPAAGYMYTSQDPRTIDVTRNMRILYDRPPLQTRNTQPLQHLYTDPSPRTGFYPDYQDIHAGQIMYYTDAATADPYGNPPYVIPSTMVPTLLQDPMGGLHPYYEKIPLFQKNNHLFEYSFDQDTLGFREDIMSKQQEKRYSRDWNTFQLFHNPHIYYPSLFTSP